MDGYFETAVARPQPPPPPPARRSPYRLLVALLAVGVLLTAAAVVVSLGRARAVADLSLHAVEEPAPAAAGWGPSYVDDQGRPARWDPCRPIPYVVLGSWLPSTGRADLTAALARLSAASGLRFVDEGDTDELPSRTRAAYQPGRYGKRWAPVLIAWVPPSQTDVGVGGGVQGVAVAVATPGRDGGSIVSGQLVLDADRRLPSGFGPGATEGEVLLHELAHIVGLGHVLDPTQVMYPETTNNESQYGAGDRAGLAALGRAAGCHPAPPARPLRLPSADAQ